MIGRDVLVGVLCGGVLLGGCTPPRQADVPEITFADTPDTILTRYSAVPAAAWVGGERWVVVSPEYEEAIRIDFETGRKAILGDSSEYRNPVGVFAVADTVFLTDWGRRRFTVWGPDDRLLGAYEVPPETRGALPRARDAGGQFYFEVSPQPGRLGEGNRDSAAVVRSSPDLTRFDTIARLAPLDIAEVMGQTGRRYERRVFSGNDRWGVAADGSVWLARVYQNRVYWQFARGQRVRGSPLPDPVYEVTLADKEYFIQQFPEELRQTAEELPFALVKPPFEGALLTPDMELLLQKSRVLTDSVRRYQVVGTDGELDRVLVLPGNGYIIATADDRVLVAEQHLGGVRLLQFAIPSTPPVPSPDS